MGKIGARPTYLLTRRSQRRKIQLKIKSLLLSRPVLSFLPSTQPAREQLGSSAQSQGPESIDIVDDSFPPPTATSDREDQNSLVIENSTYIDNGNSDDRLIPSDEGEHSDRTLHDNSNFLISLRHWSLRHNQTRSSLSDLLKLLRSHHCFDKFPLDSRTLLQTPKRTEITSIGGGEITYFGIKHGLENFYSTSSVTPDDIIHLHINIDGLPIFKSSSVEFWPILCNIVGTSKVFPIAIYSGSEKPSDLNLFLKDFIKEANELQKSEFELAGKLCKAQIKCFTCDAPARAFVCAIKGHTGYYGCGKCEVKGKYVQNRVVFLKQDIVLRTDESFRRQSQSKHHNGHTPLAELDVDLVQDFPYEYMHLVCLGVTKKLLKLWKEGKHKGFRLRPKTIVALSERLELTKSKFTNDFVRRPRSLKELDRWKATELRSFLLYTGPVVLKGLLEEKYFHHFLILSVSIRLLAKPNQTEENISYAESLLEFFTHQFKELYGREHLSYNVHGLIHLANDVRRHGELDSFSAFKFENYLGSVKKLVRSSNLPLQQVHRRLAERESLPYIQPVNSIPKHSILINNCSVSSIPPNNIVLTKGGDILEVSGIVEEDSIKFVVGKKFKIVTSLFIYPCDSKLLDVHETDITNLRQCNSRWNISSLAFKTERVIMAESIQAVSNFAIVHFLVDNSVEVVPKAWMSEDFSHCYYPPSDFKKSVKRSVKDGKPPDDGWPCFQIKVFRWFDNYLEAKDKIKMATVTSDLSEDDAAKKTVAHLQLVLPAPPTLANSNENSTRPPRNQEEGEQTSINNSLRGYEQNNPQQPILPEPQNYTLVIDDQNFKTDVLEKLEEIMKVQKEQGLLLDSIIAQLGTQQNTIPLEDGFVFESNTFPSKTVEQLQKLDEITTANYFAKKQLRLLLFRCGGDSIDDAVNNMIGKLSDDKLAADHSYRGKGRKAAFSTYSTLIDVMLDTLAGNPRTRMVATRDALDKSIPRVLKRIADRVNQRKKSVKTAESFPENADASTE